MNNCNVGSILTFFIPSSFENLSNLIDLDLEAIKLLNPSYKINIIPEIKERTFHITLPIKKIEYFLANKDTIFSQLDLLDEDVKYPAYEEMVKKIVYKIKKGDCLSKIANNFDCKIKDILLWNNMKSTTIVAGKKLKIYVDADYE